MSAWPENKWSIFLSDNKTEREKSGVIDKNKNFKGKNLHVSQSNNLTLSELRKLFNLGLE